jgi:medium-chain acyl-[acyl-carrier-protein] hydrolase
MTQLKEYTHKYFLTAGECNPQQEMPLSLVLERVVEVSTEHANAWGVGYSQLKKDNQGWVLSRVTIEMTRYPKANEAYSVTTWIEDYNRRFSQRNMSIQDGNGNIIGYARTIWVVMNWATRESVDISKLSYIRENVSGRPCPIADQTHFRPIEATRKVEYQFQYTDTDVNRHVNSVRYAQLMMNLWDLKHYDEHFISRFEIAYKKECPFGAKAFIKVDDSNPDDCCCQVDVDDVSHCNARFVFSKRI